MKENDNQNQKQASAPASIALILLFLNYLYTRAIIIPSLVSLSWSEIRMKDPQEEYAQSTIPTPFGLPYLF